MHRAIEMAAEIVTNSFKGYVMLKYCHCADPCIDGPCYDGVACTKVTDTEFQCDACPRGLRGDGRGQDGCQNVDECKEASPCFPGAECNDLVEGYHCGICPEGFTGGELRGYDLNDTNVLTQVSRDLASLWAWSYTFQIPFSGT